MKAGWQKDNFRRMISHMKAVNRKVIDVGIVEPKPHNSNGRIYQTAQIYQWMEQGTNDGHVPARPTLMPAFRQNRPFNTVLVNNLMYASVKSGNYMGSLNDFGRAYTKLVKHNIMSLTVPPLSPYTIERKGSTKPLIETGILHTSIGYKIK